MSLIVNVPGRRGPRQWRHQERLEVHESVAAQPESGRLIHSLAVAHSHLYLGYGDANENTGPIQLVSYELGTGAPHSHILIATEAIHDMALAPNGELVVLWADPSGGFWDGHDITVGRPGAWRHERIGHYTHMDSITFTDDGSWWAGGTKSDDGVNSKWGIWRRSPDGTWTNSYLSPATENGRGLSVRLYAQGSEIATSRPLKWDGSAWVEAEPVSYQWPTLELSGVRLTPNAEATQATTQGRVVCQLPLAAPDGSLVASRMIHDDVLYTGHQDGSVHVWTL